MPNDIHTIITTIKSAKKSMGAFGQRQLLEEGKPLTEPDLKRVEQQYNFQFPDNIRIYLLALGSGNLNDFYIPNTNMIHPLGDNCGEIEGFIAFSSDAAGNYFAFDPSQKTDAIFYSCYEPESYGQCANSLEELLEKLIDSEYDISKITRPLTLMPV